MTGTKNYDSEFCGKLPLHQINLIQPYGWLVVVKRTDLTIIQVSENIETLLTVSLDDIIGSNLSAYASEKLISVLETRSQKGILQKFPVAFTLRVKTNLIEMVALVHIKEEYLILELEKISAKQQRSFLDLYEEVSLVTVELQSAKTTADVCNIAAQELKRVSGFDKVMIYHFDDQWNGTVWAEASEPGMAKYLGLKFPASDVPKQARDLYLKNAYRLIPDRTFQSVRLYPVMNPLSEGFIDLSDCNLRGVAAVHLEYLKNMAVTASMSIRILKDGKLWGLISCHHREAKYLNFEQCAILEMIANFVSEKITALINKDIFDRTASMQEMRSKLMDRVYSMNSVTDGLISSDLLSLFNATGAAVVLNRSISLVGKTPDRNEVENIVYWLQSKEQQSVFAHTGFSNVYEQAADYSSIASGIIAIPLRPEKGDFVLIFRPEVIQTVNWGGNPDEAIQFEPDKKHYHPRNSFAQWKQTLQRTAVPWSETEITAAEQLRGSITEFSTRHLN